MLARIAHELFWLGRSFARADHTARMLEGVFNAELEGRRADPGEMTLSWDALLAIMGVSAPPGGDGPMPADRVMHLLVADATQIGSIVASVDAARERARAVRDVISLEMWEVVNTSHMRICQRDIAPVLRYEPASVFELVRERCALFWGVQRRTMLRDDGWAFLNAGAEFEAADMLVRMLRVALPVARAGDGAAQDGPALVLLRAAGGLQAFRRSVASAPHAIPVARFLLFEPGFPDSVAACIDGLRRALASADPSAQTAPPVLRVARLAADLEFRRREDSRFATLLDTLAIAETELGLLDIDIAERYFAGADRPTLQVANR